MATLQNNRKNQDQILGILVRDWNPDDLPNDTAAQGYEGFVPDIYRFLLSGATREELARHLYDKDVIASGVERFDSYRWAVAESAADRLLSLKITP
jgi:hypothetical protein